MCYWLIELEIQLIEHVGYGQVGHKIPVDIQKGTVFYRRVKNWKIISDEFQEFTYQRNMGIIEPWDGLSRYYNCLDQLIAMIVNNLFTKILDDPFLMYLY